MASLEQIQPASKLLSGKNVMITGASRGIGAAIAQAMSAEGARVALTYHNNPVAAEKISSQCGGETLVLALDVTSRLSIESAVSMFVTQWGHLDVLVNNAGYLKQQPLQSIDDDDWSRTIDTNLKGVFLVTQIAAQLFEAQAKESKGTFSIVNITSVGGQMGGTKAPHYAAAKAGVISLTKSAAKLLAPLGVRVNAVAPGFIKTDMYEQVLVNSSEAEILAGIPLGYVGLPDDVANSVIFLASEKARYITGHVLNVNGGAYLGAGS
ncbi:MAG: SDR family NAD(P)-dependent oxidoreductase [Thiohalomonadales bacterium]